MSVESNDLFNLINYTSFQNGHTVYNAAFTESTNFIYGFVLCENKQIYFCYFPKHRKEEKLKCKDLASGSKLFQHSQDLGEEFKLQRLEWFSHESLRAKHLSFNPLGDYCLVVCENFDLYVICVEKLLSTNIILGKTSSGLSWNREVVSLVYRFRPDMEANYGLPTCVYWWETSDFIQMGIIGTDLGHVLLINLVTGSLMSSCMIKGSVKNMEIMVDAALDSVHLLVTTSVQQWRILVEQRCTGYVWGCGDTCGGPPMSPRVSNGVSTCPDDGDTGAVQRTRLQSIKQMSVDRIANLRHRLAEGRRMLKTRSEVDEAGPGSARVECVASDVASSSWSVQRDVSHQNYFLAGVTI